MELLNKFKAMHEKNQRLMMEKMSLPELLARQNVSYAKLLNPEKLVPGEEFDGHTTFYYLLKYCLDSAELQDANSAEYADKV